MGSPRRFVKTKPCAWSLPGRISPRVAQSIACSSKLRVLAPRRRLQERLADEIERTTVEAQDQHPSSPRRPAFSLCSNGNLTHVRSSGTAAGGIVGRVPRKRKSDGSPADQAPGPVALELSPQRAFVLHLDARAHPPHRMLGRVEPVTAGRIARVRALRELTIFLVEGLRDAAGSWARS